jgi:hypothetical protein
MGRSVVVQACRRDGGAPSAQLKLLAAEVQHRRPDAREGVDGRREHARRAPRRAA